VDEGPRDVQQLHEYFTPDAVFDLSTFSGWPGEPGIRGLDAFVAFRNTWMEPYDDWSYEAEKILDAGTNRVVTIFHQRGKPRGSDSWIEMRYGIVYSVEEGLISRGQVYATPEEALEAVGLSE
jgi:ketosteroid isomerase-like protein